MTARGATRPLFQNTLSLPGIAPIAPVGKVVCIRRMRLDRRFKHRFGLCHEFLLPFQGDGAQEDRGTQENEIGVQYVASAVLVDFRNFAGRVKFLDHIPLDIHLAGLVDHVRRQVQSAAEPGASKIGEQFMQVDMRLKVVSVAGLLIGRASEVEPLWNTDSVSEGGQLHQRQVE